MARKLGTLTITTDDDGREIRERVDAIAECPTCGKDVELVSDTEEWIEWGGQWVHNAYGPSQGVCCHNLIVDSFDGCRVYRLKPAATAPEDNDE